MYPRTLSMRFGIKSCRRFNCTSISDHALCTRLRSTTMPLNDAITHISAIAATTRIRISCIDIAIFLQQRSPLCVWQEHEYLVNEGEPDDEEGKACHCH